MNAFIDTYLRILAVFGIFAFPLIALQLVSLIRMICLLIKHRRLKAENKADKKETALLICYCILTAFLWLPLIIIPLSAAIKFRTR